MRLAVARPLQRSQRAVATAAADELLRAVIGSRPPKEPKIWWTGPRRKDVRHTAACLHLLASVRRESLESHVLPVSLRESAAESKEN